MSNISVLKWGGNVQMWTFWHDFEIFFASSKLLKIKPEINPNLWKCSLLTVWVMTKTSQWRLMQMTRSFRFIMREWECNYDFRWEHAGYWDVMICWCYRHNEQLPILIHDKIYSKVKDQESQNMKMGLCHLNLLNDDLETLVITFTGNISHLFSHCFQRTNLPALE